MEISFVNAHQLGPATRSAECAAILCSPCSWSPRFTGRNTWPSDKAAAEVQASIATFTHVDWNGEGRTKVGVFRIGFFWVLDTNGNQIFDQGIDEAFAFGGITGDKPVVGKW